ncbi:MAG: hypothetical protein KTR35_02175 [Gammaproteobacteria bacterium]|nr:hypothetical protein [Gammaproteobacteria bacterium]
MIVAFAKQSTFLERPGLAAAVALVLSLSSCGWVDSTGRQDNESPQSEVQLDDGQVADALVLNEQAFLELEVVGSDPEGDALSWSWSDGPIGQGALDACAGIVNYPFEFMSQSLASACTSEDACAVVFEELSADSTSARFRVTAPELKAPVGLIYNLVTQDSGGASSATAYTFCLASINEAPTAVDDSFAVLEGNTLIVTADQVNLLSNDTDDLDASNEPLQVTRVVRPPLADDVFEVRSDGGFTYSFIGNNPDTEIVDSFVYEITDGFGFSTATVTLRVVPVDDPPEQLSDIPDIEVVAGVEFSEDLSDYFNDPENGALTFSADPDDFPESGGVTLSDSGIFGGVAEQEDEGEYTIAFFVTDGSAGLDSVLTLEVEENEPVETESVQQQRAELGERFTLAMSQFFEDPEDQVLTYGLRVDSSSASVAINTRTGVISGFFRATGIYELEVSADDGINDASVISVSVAVRAL